MLVYKTIFKIMKRNSAMILISLGITIFFSIVMNLAYNSNTKLSFTETSLNVAIMNHDASTPLLNGLITIISNKNEIVDLKDDDNIIQDALYFREVNYVLIIPKGFTEDFIAGKDVELEKRTVEASFSSVNMDMVVDRYLNLYQFYENTTDLVTEEIVMKLQEDLGNAVETVIEVNQVQKKDGEAAEYYFNYLNYTILAGFTVCTASILLVFNKFDLKRRNACSPMSLTKLNSQLFMGILTFGVGLILIMLAISFVMYPETMTSSIGVMYIINLITFMIVGMSFSLFLSQVANKADILDSVTTVVSLGTSFICGVFIPIEFIGESVQKIARFVPSYWYTSANGRISKLTEIEMETVTPILQDMGIQLAFAVALFALALLASKQKRQAES